MGVERGAGLVHEQHFRRDRDGAGDAEALLLTAGKRETALLQIVLDLIPEGRAAQRRFHQFILVGLIAVDTRAKEDVVADRARERVRFLEDHADAPPHLNRVHRIRVDVRAFQQHAALSTHAADEFIHAVDPTQQRALAAAGGTDDGRDLLARKPDGDISNGLEIPVP